MAEDPRAAHRVASARPETTAALMAGTGLDEEILRDLVRGFYGRVRGDQVLGPVFAARIADWGPHLERMVAFWFSVALAAYYATVAEANDYRRGQVAAPVRARRLAVALFLDYRGSRCWPRAA